MMKVDREEEERDARYEHSISPGVKREGAAVPPLDREDQRRGSEVTEGRGGDVVGISCGSVSLASSALIAEGFISNTLSSPTGEPLCRSAHAAAGEAAAFFRLCVFVVLDVSDVTFLGVPAVGDGNNTPQCFVKEIHSPSRNRVGDF
ncbi:hypothetical protein EYF80_050329 [Liparis tanakae]|uniref:Uncharacterized protein n=1 Tax=Liparis tanakae TaxID=230148 RepID=A0A4Z2FF41_9TELE|nr:hypothetical protein EYF80_050329 [Liparis tanakae]